MGKAASMRPAIAIAFSVPDYVSTLPTITLAIAALMLILGLVLPTYGKTLIGALIVVLVWIVLAIFIGLPIIQELGFSLSIIAILVSIAIVGHSLRLAVVVGLRHMRGPSNPAP